MNIGLLGIKIAMQSNGSIYLPYTLCNMSESDEEKVKAVILRYTGEQVDSLFNFWDFWKIGDRYFASRSTWTQTTFGGSLDEVLKKIEDYYNR